MIRPMKWLDIPPVWLLATLLIAWGEGAAFARPEITALTAIGTVLFWGGLFLIIGAVVQMFIARTTPIPHMQPDALVSSGFFRVSRNPIYLGDLLVLAGCCLRWEAYAALVLVPVLGWIITHRFIRAEEGRLRQAFGSAFDGYAARTRRWI